MDRDAFNELLLNLGISTAGLAFGLSMPIMLRLLRKALHLKSKSKYADLEAYGMMAFVALCTVIVLVFKEHITVRRIFFLMATSTASLVLWIVRDVGSGTRKDCE